jgi:ethanolamine utilization protein EutN
MRTALVVGNVVSTIKHPTHESHKLMIVRPVNEKGEFTGKEMIAVDIACSGKGDYVLIVDEGGASRIAVDNIDTVIDAVIVGVIDTMHVNIN